MTRWQGLSLRLGLALLAFSALLFYPSLEDAYVLPQRLGLTLAALLLCAGAAGESLPSGPVLGAALGWFAWRVLCRVVAGASAPGTAVWLAGEAPLWAVLLAGAAALRQAPLRTYTATLLLAAGGLGAGYALLGSFGLDPWHQGALDLGFGRRAYGSLGNPDFLGGWLALLLPLAVSAAWASLGRARAVAAGVAALLALALLQTQARASWLAGATGVMVALAGLRLSARAWLTTAGAGLALALALLFLPGHESLTPRLREGAALDSGAWQGRRMMSGVALQLAQQQPWLGVGPGFFTDAFLEAQAPRLAADRAQPYRFTEDAHDDWAQAAAECGWPGLALWAACFTLALAAAWRAGGPAGAALAGGLAAFGVQGCFHFPWHIVPTAALATLGLAAAAALATPAGSGTTARLRPTGWALLAVALLLSLGLGWRQAQASACLNQGSSLQGSARLPWLQRAAALAPQDVRAWTRLGQAQVDAGQLAEAVESYRRAARLLPHLSEAWAGLALAQGMAASQPGAAPGVAALAEACGRQAVALDPRSAEAWSNLAKVVYLRGRPDEAVQVARQGLSQADESARSWFNLGAMLYNQGRLGEAADALRTVLRLDPTQAEAARLLRSLPRAR